MKKKFTRLTRNELKNVFGGFFGSHPILNYPECRSDADCRIPDGYGECPNGTQQPLTSICTYGSCALHYTCP